MLPRYNGGRSTFCRCVCDCGNESIKSSKYLQSAKSTPSCGCISTHPKTIKNARVDYTGQVFGDLKVVETLYGYDKHGRSRIRCVCKCGNECVKDPQSIKKYHNPPHCGCKTEYYKKIQSEKYRKDLTGIRFGYLTAIEMIYKYNEGTYVKCVCDCGNEIIVKNTYLTSGDTKSCGCMQYIPDINSKDFSGMVSEYGVKLISRNRKNDKNQWLWNCECGCCGSTFTELPAKVFNGHTTSCGCAKRSSGERLISLLLEDMNVEFETERTFEGCANKHKLRFDFYIDSLSVAIEYQGIQHYFPSSKFGGDKGFKIRQENDNIKREFCEKNGITLIEIPYTMKETEIKELLQTLFIPRDCNG